MSGTNKDDRLHPWWTGPVQNWHIIRAGDYNHDSWDAEKTYVLKQQVTGLPMALRISYKQNDQRLCLQVAQTYSGSDDHKLETGELPLPRPPPPRPPLTLSDMALYLDNSRASEDK